MNLFGWLKGKEKGAGTALAQWRTAWTAAIEGGDATDDELRRRLESLAPAEPDVEIELEMMDALEQLRTAQQAAAAGALPTIETGHRVIGAERCHFSAPASLPADQVQAAGRVLLTGTGRCSSAAAGRRCAPGTRSTRSRASSATCSSPGPTARRRRTTASTISPMPWSPRFSRGSSRGRGARVYNCPHDCSHRGAHRHRHARHRPAADDRTAAGRGAARRAPLQPGLDRRQLPAQRRPAVRRSGGDAGNDLRPAAWLPRRPAGQHDRDAARQRRAAAGAGVLALQRGP